MTDLQEKAMGMALEVMEYNRAKGTPNMGAAIEALRQALDKPEIESKVLVDMAVLAEREACAKVCDAADKSTHPAELADAIRARGEK